MSTTEIKSRVMNKRDTHSNWSSSNPVILNGEIILVETEDGLVRRKIGDGTSHYSQLDFDDKYLVDHIDELESSSRDHPHDDMVPNTRTINGKALSEDIVLSANDVDADGAGAASTAEANARLYAETLCSDLKNELLNGAGKNYDTLKELGDLIDDNADAISALETIATSKANKADIATTAMQGTATQNNTYWKISDFGNWGTGNWMTKSFSMLISSRAGEMVWVSLAANDSNTSAGAFRLINRYSKIAAIHYSVSESAIYVTAAGWANNICAHIISNVNGDYVPTIAAATALPSDAVAINIVEFGITADSTVVGNSSVPLLLGGSTYRPKYNNNDLLLYSDFNGHAHAISEVTNLQTALDGKAPNSHSHGYIQDGTVGLKTSDSNEVNFSSNASYIYFGYNNRMGSSGVVTTYNFGRHSGTAGASDGDINCGAISAGRLVNGGKVNGKTVTVDNKAVLQYDSTNECLNFTFA